MNIKRITKLSEIHNTIGDYLFTYGNTNVIKDFI